MSDDAPGVELESIVPEELLQPLTGELVPSRSMPDVADALEHLREHKRQVDTAVAAFTFAAIAESKRQGTKTLNFGDGRIEISADSEVEWDVTVLVELLALGLPTERYAQLVEETVVYKVNGRVAKQLEGASEAYADVIRRARIRTPKKPYASVKR